MKRNFIKSNSILINALRNIGLKLSKNEEELLKKRNLIEAEKRLRIGDPPCVVCGKWSNDWLCPECRNKFPWMHPKLR